MIKFTIIILVFIIHETNIYTNAANYHLKCGYGSSNTNSRPKFLSDWGITDKKY